VVEVDEARYDELVAPDIGLVVQPDDVYHWDEYGVVPSDGLAVRVMD